MKHKVPWNRTLLEDFIKEGLLTEDEEFIMRTRLAGWAQVKQAMERNISTATVSNIAICNFMCMLEENAGLPEEVQTIKKYRKKIGEM